MSFERVVGKQLPDLIVNEFECGWIACEARFELQARTHTCVSIVLQQLPS
jgi:hypothetical protein